MPRRRVADRIPPGRRIAGRAWATVLAAASSMAAVGLPTGSHAAGGEASFEQAFATDGEPVVLHFRAVYGADADADADADAGPSPHGVHRLEVWRDHATRIRRRTDDRIDIVATRLEDEGEGGIRFTVVDVLRRRTSTIDRVDLMRLGLFVDWFSQGHAVLRPAGPYRLVRLDRMAADPLPGRPCAWWRLARQQSGTTMTTDICWNEQWKLPLLMQDAQQRVVWRVLAVDDRPIDDAVFAPSVGAVTTAQPGAAFEADGD